MNLIKIEKNNRLVGYVDSIASETQWLSYYWQIKSIQKHLNRNQSLVEVGPGHGVLKRELNALKYNVVAVDVDERKKPDILCDILDIDWEKLNVKAVALFEVLEHISLDENKIILQKMARANIGTVFISVPINGSNLIAAGINVLSYKWIGIKLKRKTKIGNTHKWEINCCAQMDGILLSLLLLQINFFFMF
jgi:2-polyprenyl-3-methyl-5-hydroxy-6-metoxy-1,4-benzoquinol methylase